MNNRLVWREYRKNVVHMQVAPPYPFVLLWFPQMEALVSALPYAEIVLGILLIAGVVLQQRGASLGGAFGGDNFASTFYKRRGAEKFLFNATILIAVLLVLAAIANFLLAGS
ncbi:preprotein translocase subunit SecG [Candidatus Kaiserbacteria bacterium]|nr:preprotein translocase subunit SecG [Candidatus Kaiserbacteria bacterium]